MNITQRDRDLGTAMTQLFGFGFWQSMVGGGLLSLGYLCAQAFLPELIRDYWRDRFGSKP
jgi:hypothetical protein